MEDRVTWERAVAMVTGASRGIGRAVARMAAQRGAQVGLVARTEPELAAALDEIGGRGTIAVADVGDLDQVRTAVDRIEAELGPIDIAVANAGVGLYGPFIDAEPDEMERLVRANVLGTMYTCRSVLVGMTARRRGHLVIIGSIAGRVGSPFEAVYSATKFAGVGLTEALSVELSAFGIGVSMVNPGPVDTSFFDARGHRYERRFPRMVPADKVARAVMGAVEHRRFEQVVPRWLRQAAVSRHLIPTLYRSGARRSFRRELADLAANR